MLNARFHHNLTSKRIKNLGAGQDNTVVTNSCAQGDHVTAGQVSGVGLVCIPNRYMHGPVEMVSLHDLNREGELIAHFCASVNASDDFTR